MTTPFWITLATVTATCGITLLMQSQRNHALGLQIIDRRAALVDLESDLKSHQTVAADFRLQHGRPPTPGSREQAIAENRASTTPTERVSRARSHLDQLMAGVGEPMRSPADFFRVLPDMLRVIQDLSLDELVSLADGIQAKPGSSQGNPLGLARMIFYLLAAEQDPRRVMRNEEIMKDREARDAVLGALATQDPQSALAWLKNSSLNELDRERAVGVMALRIMREDIENGLKLLRESGMRSQMNLLSIGALPATAERLPELVAAMRNPENADFRRHLLNLTMTAAMSDGGVDRARQRVEELGITNREVSEYLTTTGHSFVNDSGANQVFNWMREVLSADEWGQAFPNAIAQWAQRDYNAAGEWLGQQESSPEKDRAVQSFVQTVSPVDPQSAVIWAESIKGEKARAASIVYAAEQWLAKDQPAAEKWLAEKAINLTALRERAKGAGNPSAAPQSTSPSSTTGRRE